MKKILVIGASGAIGKAVADDLSKDHEVIRASSSGIDVAVNVNDKTSLDVAMKDIGNIDGAVIAVGKASFGQLVDIELEDGGQGMGNKFIGQIRAVKAIMPYLNENGTITLTSGILNDQTIKDGVFAAAANGALNAFVEAQAKEMRNGQRINIISPSLIEDSEDGMGHMFPGFEITLMKDVVNAYRHSVLGMINGKVLRLYRPI